MGGNYKFKVVMLGDFGVGKTSLVRRYVYNIFEDRYMTTIGVKVSKKQMMMRIGEADVDITLLLWDIAGNNGFSEVSSEYLRGTSAGIFVGDLTRIQTVTNINRYIPDMRKANPRSRCVIALNKTDLCLDIPGETQKAVDALRPLVAPEDLHCFGTSAKNGSNVPEMFERLSRLIMEGADHAR